jgi:hypothetical protein
MFTDLLPWLNVLIIPTLVYVVSIERRITRLETFREAEAPAHLRRQPHRT